MPPIRHFIAIMCFGWLALTAPAMAYAASEAALDIQLFRPIAGATGFLSTESGRINPHLSIHTGLSLNYSRKTLSLSILNADGSTDAVADLVKDRFDTTVFASLGLFNWIELGAAFPLVTQGGYEADKLSGAQVQTSVQGLESFILGDLRLIPKIQLVRRPYNRFAMALIGTVTVPTSTGHAYAGETEFVIAPALALSSAINSLIRIGVNVGYRFREAAQVQVVTVDDQLFYSAAIAFNLRRSVVKPFEIIAEVMGHTAAKSPFGLGSDSNAKAFSRVLSPIELDLGIKTLVLGHVLISGGAGIGLMPGFGAPLPRVFTSVSFYSGDPELIDSDNDRVPDLHDLCPDRIEDHDGFQDADGCLDIDNDDDKISDDDDQCPNEPEDLDQFEDEDGCPDRDNDKDGLADAIDKCPSSAEDVDGFADDDGCPEPDNDNDGLLDAVDRCPREAEDFDKYRDEDGCPELDNDRDDLADLNDLCPNHAEDLDGVEDGDGCPDDDDKDGIEDALDRCPGKPENYNGNEDGDGCPDAGRPSLLSVRDDSIATKREIVFGRQTARLSPHSLEVLDQLASLLRNYRTIVRLRITSYVDVHATKTKNVRLGQQRAASIRDYLQRKGVARSRLETVGQAANGSLNERIEFTIVQRSPFGKDVSQKPASKPSGNSTIEFGF